MYTTQLSTRMLPTPYHHQSLPPSPHVCTPTESPLLSPEYVKNEYLYLIEKLEAWKTKSFTSPSQTMQGWRKQFHIGQAKYKQHVKHLN